jgi:hypothetical protein
MNSRQALRRSKGERKFLSKPVNVSPDATKIFLHEKVFLLLAALLNTIDHGGLVLQLTGSAPIFSPRSAKLFTVSFTKVPATGGNQSPGIDTMRTSASALRLSRATSAIANRCRTAVAVEARVAVRYLSLLPFQ